MTANLRILAPDGTTNYITNPSMRYDVLGYTAFGSTLSRTLDYARFNIASLKVITNGAALGEGVYWRANSLFGISDPITASVYVRGTGIVRLRIIDNPVGKEWFTDPIELTDRWTRLFVSGFSTGTSDVRVYVETAWRVRAATLYVDGWQLERKPYPTTFCDGDQDGCRWDGTYHASSSSRSAYTRAGGRWVDLAGPCREEDNIYVTVLAGMGAIPQQSQTQSWSLQPGSFFQDTKILNRKMTLTFFVKNPKRLSGGQPDLRPLHKLRQQLIDVIKPDVTEDSEEFLLEYQEGDKPLYLRARYDSGLEGEWDIRNQWVNSFPVIFSATYPFFKEDNNNVMQLGLNASFPHANSAANKYYGIFGRIDGQWRIISFDGTGFIHTPSNVYITTVVLGQKGEVYFGGSADGVVMSDGFVARWDGTTLTKIGIPTGDSSSLGIVNDIAVAANGDLYITGSFTSVNGVAATNIAKYTLATGVWSALGLGVGGVGTYGYSLCVATNGDLYCSGLFTVAGGVACNGLARWSGGQWYDVVPGFQNPSISYASEMKRGIDGRTIFMVGSFTFDSTGTINYYRAAQVDTETHVMSPMGNGFNGNAYALNVGKDGTVYATGSFTADGVDATRVLNRVAFWNGESWFQLGDPGGGDHSGRAIQIGPKGEIIVAGGFNSLGGVDNKDLAVWSGGNFDKSKWGGMDLWRAYAGTEYYFCALAHPNGDFYCGGQFWGLTTVFSGYINSVVNLGTAQVGPLFYISGSGNLKRIENQTTGAVLYFRLSLLANEEVFIDCEKGRIVSTIRGDISYAVVPISSLKDFTLAPGENKIITFMINDVQGKIQIGYVPRHWSADATTKIEELQ